MGRVVNDDDIRWSALVPYGPKVTQGARDATDRAIALLEPRFPDVDFGGGAYPDQLPSGETLIVLLLVAEAESRRALQAYMPVSIEALDHGGELMDRYGETLADTLVRTMREHWNEANQINL